MVVLLAGALPASAMHATRPVGEVDAVHQARWTDGNETLREGVTGEGIAALEFEGYNSLHPDLDHCSDPEHHRVGVGATASGPGPVDDVADAVPGSAPMPANGALRGTPGHGNHIAGIVCGSGELSDGRHAGVAPDGRLFSMHTCWGSCNISDWFTEEPLRVVTSSTGGDFDPVGSMRSMGMPADADVLFTQAAGNSGGSGDERRTDASIDGDPRILAVAAAKADGSNVAAYSSRGLESNASTWPDITAPGCMMSTAPPPSVDAHAYSLVFFAGFSDGETCPEIPPEQFAEDEARGYAMLAGTSMASPYVAGVALLMFEVNPDLSALDAKFLLTRTADPFLPAADRDLDGRVSPEEFREQYGFKAGYGLVNATAAVAAAHYAALHPDASREEAVACSTVGEVDGTLHLNPEGGSCPSWWTNRTESNVDDGGPPANASERPSTVPASNGTPSSAGEGLQPGEANRSAEPSRSTPTAAFAWLLLALALAACGTARGSRGP